MRNTLEALKDQRVILGHSQIDAIPRIKLNSPLWDTLLDGGPDQGRLILVGGDEGSGKSTTLLEACFLADCPKTLYVSGEERAVIIAQRGQKLGFEEMNRVNERCAIVSANDTESIFAQADDWHPQLMVIDSQQTFASPRYAKLEPGSITQQKWLIRVASEYAHRTGVVIFIVGQLTQAKKLAGPSRSRFMVDATSLIARDERSGVRKAKCPKSRFCATHVEVHYDIYGKQDGGLGIKILWVGKRVPGDKTYGQPDPTLYDEAGNYVGPTAGEVARRYAEGGLLGASAFGPEDDDDAPAKGKGRGRSAGSQTRASTTGAKPAAQAKTGAAKRGRGGLRLLKGGGQFDPNDTSRGGVDGGGYDLRKGDAYAPDPAEAEAEDAPARAPTAYEKATQVQRSWDDDGDSDADARMAAWEEHKRERAAALRENLKLLEAPAAPAPDRDAAPSEGTEDAYDEESGEDESEDEESESEDESSEDEVPDDAG